MFLLLFSFYFTSLFGSSSLITCSNNKLLWVEAEKEKEEEVYVKLGRKQEVVPKKLEVVRERLAPELGDRPPGLADMPVKRDAGG